MNEDTPGWLLMDELDQEIKEVEALGFTAITDALLSIRELLKVLGENS